MEDKNYTEYLINWLTNLQKSVNTPTKCIIEETKLLIRDLIRQRDVWLEINEELCRALSQKNAELSELYRDLDDWINDAGSL